MPRDKHPGQAHREERGVSLVIVAFGLVALLGFAALAIDLAFLYVGRSEAQRAADAAALAGAKEFRDSGFSTGVVTQAQVQPLATQAAEAVGSQNFVGGQPVVILDSDVTFDFLIPNDPRITVTVARDANHPGGPLPTFFAKAFGVFSANISAKATAEAYNPGTTGPPVAVQCLKPWLLPNCDPNHSTPAAAINSNCTGTGGPFAKFVDTQNCQNTAIPGVCNPGAAPTGAIGELMVLKPGSPSSASGPSKYYPVNLPITSAGQTCPACAGGSSGGGAPSGDVYFNNIACCNLTGVACGLQPIQAIVGNKVGPTAQGVDCLIHEGNNGSGQDILKTDTSGYPVVPTQITGGLNNPYPGQAGQTISSSDSIVNIPLYDGSILCPGMGGSCGTFVNVVGYLQVFIKDETSPQGTVEAYIMNVSVCGSGGSVPGSPPPPITSTSPVPIRLIRNP